MDKEIWTFGNIETEKNKFYRQKTPIFWESFILVSKRITFGERNYKYFIGYLYHNHKVKSLQIQQEAAF